MNTKLFARYTQAIRNFDGAADATQLLIAADGALAAYYAPFDAVNPKARVVLVGITPGRTQAVDALAEARRQLLSGASAEHTVQQAKRTAAFSGAMRANLTAMLDHIGLNRWLGIDNCDALFADAGSLLQSTSVLPFPVFLNGANYNGTPEPLNTPMLRDLVLEHFVPLVRALPQAIFVPLGPVPTKVMQWLATQGHISHVRVLSGLPHPSGANAERVHYFLGKKSAAMLSAKTNPGKLDEARLRLQAVLASLI